MLDTHVCVFHCSSRFREELYRICIHQNRNTELQKKEINSPNLQQQKIVQLPEKPPAPQEGLGSPPSPAAYERQTVQAKDFFPPPEPIFHLNF